MTPTPDERPAEQYIDQFGRWTTKAERDAYRDRMIAEFVEENGDLLDRLAEGPSGDHARRREELLAKIAEEDADVLRRLADS